MAIWSLDSRSPNLTLFCFSPLMKGSDHCSLRFLRVIFFRGWGSAQRDKICCINGFENVKFCQGLQMIKTNSTCFIREEYKSLMESKGRNAGKG